MNRKQDTLNVMELHRARLAEDIATARKLAAEAGIPWERAERGAPYGRAVVVIGVGDSELRDDGAGVEVARRIRELHPAGAEVATAGGEAAGLLRAWAGAHEALVVEAVSSGGTPGTVHRFEPGGERPPTGLFRGPDGSQGVGDAIEAAASMGLLPERLSLFGIEGGDFTPGRGLSEPVESAVRELADELRDRLG